VNPHDRLDQEYFLRHFERTLGKAPKNLDGAITFVGVVLFSVDTADETFLRSIEAVINSTRRTTGLLLAASERRPVAIPLPPTITDAETIGGPGVGRNEPADLDGAVGVFRDWWSEARECGLDRSGEDGQRRPQSGVRRTRSRSVAGWSSLTETELRVAQLVSLGLTNREIGRQMFLSRFTIDRHLRHVFDKLGINSRVHLAGLTSTFLPSGAGEPVRASDNVDPASPFLDLAQWKAPHGLG
jgi:DNA-binding CsgD family transcriptional regulator